MEISQNILPVPSPMGFWGLFWIQVWYFCQIIALSDLVTCLVSRFTICNSSMCISFEDTPWVPSANSQWHLTITVNCIHPFHQIFFFYHNILLFQTVSYFLICVNNIEQV